MFLQSKLKEFSKTQWKLKDFSKTQGQNSPQNCKNSRFRKLHLPTVRAEKTPKKIPAIKKLYRQHIKPGKTYHRLIHFN